MPEPWPAISSSTITAGAGGRPEALYRSLWYCSRDLAISSIFNSYLAPNLGIISWRRFQVRPQGSFTKTLVLSKTSSLPNLFLHCRRHAREHLLRRQVIHQPQVFTFFALPIQENQGGHPFDAVQAEQPGIRRVSFLGQVHLDHDKIPVRLGHDVAMMESKFLQGPAGSAPGGREINNHRLLRLSGLSQDLIRIRLPGFSRS